MSDELDPIELQRRKMAGELDPAALRQIKVRQAAARAQAAPQKPLRRITDPIEAKRQKLAAQAARRRAPADAGPNAGAPPPAEPVPKDLVVLVRPWPPGKAPPPKPALSFEDELTLRLKQARQTLDELEG